MSFTWDPDINQTYTENFGDRVIPRDDFDKSLGCSFTMDAPGCELTLKVNRGSGKAFMWPVKADFSAAKKTNINVQRGRLVISHEQWEEFGIDANVCENGNLANVTVSDGAIFKIENINIETHNGSTPCEWDISGGLIMNGGGCSSPSKFNIKGHGYWELNQPYVNLSGDVVIDSSPISESGYSCLINTRTFRLYGIQFVESYGSFLVRGSSKVKISINKLSDSEVESNNDISGWISLQDNSRLTFSSDQANAQLNIMGGFQLKPGTTELYFGEAGKFCPIVLDVSDVKTGRYKGVFNFISHRPGDNRGSLIFMNPPDNFLNLLIGGDYITINGDAAYYKEQYLASRLKVDGINAIVVALKQ
ncbi:hypothetical protein [Enterobacter ludwigii]|jgi:hypothetical protein|uniref:hypothetical protein n=1 Tax=Enterobacter ludwigii TaxID=299767 RepID=UPI0013D6B507|nr:hypothetical protein [Enterobacter ludwigii]